MEILTSQQKNAALLADFYTRNSERFSPWQPRVNADHYSEDAWLRRLIERERDFQEGRAAHFIGLEDDRVVGSCSLANIVYSPGFYCYMGYCVDADYEGKEVMTRIVRKLLIMPSMVFDLTGLVLTICREISVRRACWKNWALKRKATPNVTCI